MAKPIMMPQVGQDIETGVIVEWRVKENDRVQKGDVIALVESDKATFEVEAYESGVILKILYEAGQEARVLEPIAYIGQAGEKIQEQPAQPAAAASSVETAAKSQDQKQAVETAKKGISASPSAKRLAKEHGIDLTQIKGTGPEGRIVKEDVLATVSAKGGKSRQPSTKTGDEEIPFGKIRKRIAQRLSQSKQTIPHFYLFTDIDMTTACRARAAYNQRAQEKITFNDIIVKAAASALREFPKMNAHTGQDKLIVRKNINVGIAVSVEDGLIVPVIADTDRKDINQISCLSKENAEGAKKGTLKAQSVGTFTVSNLGMYSVNGFLPIINPPECGILGIGGITKRAVCLEDGTIAGRDIMTAAIACDHRVIDGTYAAQFLNCVKNNLENFTL